VELVMALLVVLFGLVMFAVCLVSGLRTMLALLLKPARCSD
jgi:hypothetical protein